MRVSHEFTAVFDDPNLVSCAGLAPVLTLAEQAGLHELLEQRPDAVRPDNASRDYAHAGLPVAAAASGANSVWVATRDNERESGPSPLSQSDVAGDRDQR